MRHYFLSYPLIFTVFLALSGCADLSQEVAVPTVTVVRACHANIELAGRFSVRYWQDGQEQAVHGNFHWQQAGERTRVALLSPLGQTLATIELTPKAATLTLAGKAPRTAADADALAAEALGWPLPVSGLRGWLQGCVPMADGGSFVARPGQTEVRTRDGWRLHYLAWEPDGAVPRPKRIDLERQAGGGEVSLRLVIDDWRQGGQ
jgi:outer membrane lipoprotein LolB